MSDTVKCVMSAKPTQSDLDLWKQAGGGTPEFSAERYDALLREHGLWVNWDLIQELSTKPHPLLNTDRDHDHDCCPWDGEVFQEARNVHHLLDMAGVPRGTGYFQNVDARAYLLLAEVLALRERLDRVAGWHSRETGPAGSVGDCCTECGQRWPCDTRRMADGTYMDPDDRPAPGVPGEFGDVWCCVSCKHLAEAGIDGRGSGEEENRCVHCGQRNPGQPKFIGANALCPDPCYDLVATGGHPATALRGEPCDRCTGEGENRDAQ